MLASAEPEAMKSTAAMLALKAIGDPSAFLELNSTTEFIDLYRDCTSLPLGELSNKQCYIRFRNISYSTMKML